MRAAQITAPRCQDAIERAMIVSPSDVLAVDTVVPRKIVPLDMDGASDALHVALPVA